MKEPLISVIVPVYKVEKYLDRCVQSIVSQSYENLEIILVDDGSPDRSGAMCDRWAERDSRIRVIHKLNGGLSDARNAGIRACSGEYVVFVDSDDHIAPRMVELLWQGAREAQTKLAICRVCCLDEQGDRTGEADGLQMPAKCIPARELLPLLYQESGQFYIVAWNRLYHRSLLGEEAFPVGKWHEDEFVAAQLIWAAGRIALVDYEGYFYVTKRSGSIMAAKEDLRHLDVLEALLIRSRFYQQIDEGQLAHETRARVMQALENYYWGEPSEDPRYDEKMAWLRREYGALTGLTRRERLKWLVFRISPKLEKGLLGPGRGEQRK